MLCYPTEGMWEKKNRSFKSSIRKKGNLLSSKGKVIILEKKIAEFCSDGGQGKGRTDPLYSVSGGLMYRG